MDDRLLIVSAKGAADVRDLVTRALPEVDAKLADAIRGALAEMFEHALLDPLPLGA